jgi:hypothetical protein
MYSFFLCTYLFDVGSSFIGDVLCSLLYFAYFVQYCVNAIVVLVVVVGENYYRAQHYPNFVSKIAKKHFLFVLCCPNIQFPYEITYSFINTFVSTKFTVYLFICHMEK